MANKTFEQLGSHGYHDAQIAQLGGVTYKQKTKFITYTLENFFHPFVGELIEKLNQDSLPGMLDPNFHQSLITEFFDDFYSSPPSDFFTIDSSPKEIDVSEGGPYANYNWELLFHIPLTIAVHLSKNQRFAEAQRWFHYIFDPTCNDTSTPTPQRFWKFIAFRPRDIIEKDELYTFLNNPNLTPNEQKRREDILNGKERQYQAICKDKDLIGHNKLMTLLSQPNLTPKEVELRDSILQDDEWKILAFRQGGNVTQIDELLALLSKPDRECTDTERTLRKKIKDDYTDILDKPFQPHVVARTRQLTYQYCVVMKYLDNLIAWGDSLFRQDTVESINEATQCYVLAANLLGARPQRIPPRGGSRPRTFAELKNQGLDEMGNALVELEGKFPFNLNLPQTQGTEPNATRPLFGIGPTLYFCIPRNDKMLGYWDTVADRLFKIRHCMNIEGVVRQLALLDPPLDPGMLVKAAAAGIDMGSIVSGLIQPTSPVRSLFFIQKALELAGEIRGLGSALLSAIEKGDSEHMALLRQGHEIKIQQMQQETRFLQWKQAQESTESLLKSRASTLERYRYSLRLLGLTPDSNTVPDTFTIDHRELTEENFDESYAKLVGQYEKAISTLTYPKLKLEGDTSPAKNSGASGQGKLYLNSNENAELNELLSNVKKNQTHAFILRQIAPVLSLVPEFTTNFHFWGIGGEIILVGGRALTQNAQTGADVLDHMASMDNHDANSAYKTASYERRADDWILQSNLAARELIQIGRQIIGSLIAEQIAYREYQNIQKQIEHSQEVDRFLQEKFTNEELYAWMQGEISRLYYEYYRFAFDTARKAEQTMKRELMRPEVDATDYVKFNYWDGGRKGLLSGEALYLDVKRMEMAYHENNKREYELTKHISLQQLNPLALLSLKATGTCEVTLTEWLFDLDCPGHYMRRLKNVSLSIPSVAGPYTSVNCTMSLLKSSLRKSPLLLDDEYARQGSEDIRFVDYFGTIQSVVTSSGNNDSGMFETNLRDERFLPFEGAGAESTWKLELPTAFRQFDYNTISDVILHVRHTARQGGNLLGGKAVEYIEELVSTANASGLALLFSLKHDFPSEWSRFVSATDNSNFVTKVKREHFAYITQGRDITIDSIQLYSTKSDEVEVTTPQGLDLADYTAKLNDEREFELSLAPDGSILIREMAAHVFILIKYSVE